MKTIKASSTLNLFSPVSTTKIIDISTNVHTFGNLSEMKTDSNFVANYYPNEYALIAVDEEDDLGVSHGRLLFVATSLEEIDSYVESKHFFVNEFLHYVTGKNLI